MMDRIEKFENAELTLESLVKILDYSSDEIYVVDAEMCIVYVNRICEKHYGLKKDEVLGKYNQEFFEEGLWNPSIIPSVLERKEPVSLRQQTYIGAELLTRAIPILNEQGEIDFIVMTSTELTDFNRLLTSEVYDREDKVVEQFSHTVIAQSKQMKGLLKFCEKVAPTDSTVLITGESGTGKGVIAYHLHKTSKRKDAPFLHVNCAAIPQDLMESELFGYIGGAFTGANKDGKVGLFESAHTGTIFLDEIGELAPGLQAKVLQVIQEKTFRSIGDHTTKKVDVRILAATNQNLLEMVEEKTFREDLYYRLNVIDIYMPSLRERKEDLLPLISNFLRIFNEKYHANKIMSEQCLTALHHYSWPGNVRQLENLIERLVITSDVIIDVKDLPAVVLDSVKNLPEVVYANSLENAIEEVTRTMLERAYKKVRSSRAVAKELGISQSKASRLIRQYNIGKEQ